MKYSEEFPPRVDDVVFTIIDEEESKYDYGRVVAIVDDQYVLVQYGDNVYKDSIEDLLYVRERIGFFEKLKRMIKKFFTLKHSKYVI